MNEPDNHLNEALKIFAEKLRRKLGLTFRGDDYEILLDDEMISDAIIKRGTDKVTLKIKTSHFLESLLDKKTQYDFKQLLIRCLELIPKMHWDLSHVPPENVVYNRDTNKFRKVSDKELALQKDPTLTNPLLKEIHFASEYRATAIHWKSGTVVREFGRSDEIARTKARKKILALLEDPTIFGREGTDFIYLEPHEDYISDIVADAKTLNKEEIQTLIRKLEEEYLSD